MSRLDQGCDRRCASLAGMVGRNKAEFPFTLDPAVAGEAMLDQDRPDLADKVDAPLAGSRTFGPPRRGCQHEDERDNSGNDGAGVAGELRSSVEQTHEISLAGHATVQSGSDRRSLNGIVTGLGGETQSAVAIYT